MRGHSSDTRHCRSTATTHFPIKNTDVSNLFLRHRRPPLHEVLPKLISVAKRQARGSKTHYDRIWRIADALNVPFHEIVRGMEKWVPSQETARRRLELEKRVHRFGSFAPALPGDGLQRSGGCRLTAA